MSGKKLWHMVKTKIITTVDLDAPMFVDVAGGMVEVLFGDAVHKYLGRHISGDLRQRSKVEFSHRIAAAWAKFHKHRATLMNRDISVRLRLKLFQAVVSPTVLFGLTTLPLTTCQKHQLDAVQRRMLRSIVGWAKPVDGEWATAMRQTNARLKSALSLFPIDNWMYQLAGRKLKLAHRLTINPHAWSIRSLRWNPCDHDLHGPIIACRGPGRPRLKWDHDLEVFANQHFPQYAAWMDAAEVQRDWFAKEQHFHDYVCI